MSVMVHKSKSKFPLFYRDIITSVIWKNFKERKNFEGQRINVDCSHIAPLEWPFGSSRDYLLLLAITVTTLLLEVVLRKKILETNEA